MKNIPALSILTNLLLLASFTASAQMPGGPQTGVNAAMTKLFGKNTAFTSRAEVRMLDKSQKQTMTMPMLFAMLDGKIRVEMDMTQIKSKEVPADMAGTLKQMGMDKMITIVRPEKKTTLVVYPTLQAYAEVPMDKEQMGDLEKEFKQESVKLGSETIDGHPCIKNKVTLRGDKGEKHEATVWNATDLKDFPLRVQMNQTEATVEMSFKDVKLDKPDAKQFEAPASFTKHASIEAMMQGAMMKMLGK